MDIIKETFEILAAGNRSMAISIGISFVMLIIAGFLSVFLSRKIVRPLIAGVHMTEGVKNGNFDVCLKIDSADETQDMVEAMNERADDLQSTISNINEVMESVTDKISSSTELLASGNASQVSSLKEVASSMNEIEAQTKQNNNNASNTQELSAKTLEVVQNGNKKMEELQKLRLLLKNKARGLQR